MLDRLMRDLERLDGSWRGTGRGCYPTIDSFEYEEHLRFEVDRSYPMLHYEQRAYLLPDREPSHWESGFIRPLEDGFVEISNSHDSGRVEVLRGRFADAPEGVEERILELDSVVLEHDSRLVGTRRVLTIAGDTLHYRAYMATRTTPVPEMQIHLDARLERVR